MFPEDLVIDAINDSKQMTEEEREEVYEELMANDQVIKSVCVIDHERIDEINILEATMQAMTKSVEGLSTRADWVLIDGNKIPPPLVDRAEAIVKGDAKSVCIAAASVLAKVTRDRMMLKIHAAQCTRPTASTNTRGTGSRRTGTRSTSTDRVPITGRRSRP